MNLGRPLTAFLSRLPLSFRLHSSKWVLKHFISTDATDKKSQQDSSLLANHSRTFKGSAFTGKADFYEAFFFLQDILKRAQSVGEAASEPLVIPWLGINVMADRLGFALTKLQYRKIRSALNALTPYAYIGEVRSFLNTFSPIDLEEVVNARRTDGEKIVARYLSHEPNLGFIDKLGRAISIGRRKAASAKVFLVPGSGECFINGRPAIDYFKRPHEMCRIADPFNATATFGKYNAWCLVRGGGLSGQAGAIAHGIAKTIVLLAPNMKAPLQPCKLTFQMLS